MRLSSVALAIALAIGLPCAAGAIDPRLPWSLYMTLSGIGFSVGLIFPAVLDIATYHAEDTSLLRQREALTDATLLANAERQARLYAVTVPAPEPVENTDHAWRLAVETFLLAGDAQGFSIRKMAGVVGSDTWPMLTGWLAEQGILANHGAGRGYGWADGMTLARAFTQLRRDGVPYPAGPVPVVHWSYNIATRRDTTRHAATVVIENVRP